MKKVHFIISLLLISITISAQKAEYTSYESNKFALDLYKNLSLGNEENIFFSPFSVSIAMGMTYSGAKGETEKQMANVIGFAPNKSKFHNSLGELQNSITQKSTEGAEIAIANKLWAEQNFKFKRLYLKKVNKAYDAPIELISFRTKPEESRTEINKWVEDKTKEHIKDLLPPNSINNLTTLVLTNAIYFKGNWDEQFSEKNTWNGEFCVPDGLRIGSEFMSKESKYNYYEQDDLQIIELPYAGKTFSMFVILPKPNLPLFDLEKTITLDNINGYIGAMKETQVSLTLPKFKFESEYKLKPTFISMGMPNAFSNAANFKRMSRASDLKIDDIYHKAFVEVSEEGTEAAAATAVVVVLKTSVMKTEFNANRPFMFIIRDNTTGSFIFMGRVANPN